jgi:tetratricopeptide (TPR) repeat protein
MGAALHGMNHHSEALQMLLRARDQLDELERAYCDIDIAITQYKVGDTDTALEWEARSHTVFETHTIRDGLLWCDFICAVVLQKRGLYRECLQACNPLATSLISLHLDYLYVTMLATVCLCHRLLGEYDHALQLIHIGLVHSHNYDLCYRSAFFRYEQSIIATERGQTSRARRYLPIAERLCKRSGAQLLYGDILTTRSILETGHHNLDAAECALQQARSVYAGCENLEGQAIACIDLGLIEYERGNYSAALHLFTEARELSGTYHVGRTLALSNLYLGKTHSLIRNHSVARPALSQALQQFEQMGQWQLAAYAAAELGAICGLGQGNQANAESTDEAEVLFMKAIDYARRSDGSIYRAVAQRMLGEHLIERGQVERAKSLLAESADLYDSAGMGIEWAFSAVAMVECELAASENELAPSTLTLLDTIEKHSLGVPELGARLALTRAEQSQRHGDTIGALLHLNEATRHTQIMRLGADDPVLAGHIAGAFEHIDRRGMQLAFKLGDERAALIFTENRRAQWLIKELWLRHGRPTERASDRQRLTAPASAEARKLLCELRRLNLLLSEAWSVPNATRQKEIAALQQSVSDLQRQYEQFDASLMAASVGMPQHITAQPAERAVSPEQLRDAFSARFGRHWSAVELEPLDLRRNVWLLFRLTPDGFTCDELRASAITAAQLHALSTPSLDYQRRFYCKQEVSTQALRNIADWLRLDEWLPSNVPDTHTLIVADCEPFTRLSFAALPSHGAPLIGRTTLRFVPSLQLGAQWCKTTRVAESHGIEETTALFVAPATYCGPHKPLPHSLREVELCQAQWRASTLLQHEQASLSALQAANDSGRLARYGVIHIASHACFNSSQPRLSSVALNDTDLTVQDLLTWTLNAELVIVSGCESGAAVDMGGEERAGIETALLAAGSANVLTTLWSVEDEDTAQFMATFTGLYRSSNDAGAGLATAQRETIQSANSTGFLKWAGWRITGMG